MHGKTRSFLEDIIVMIVFIGLGYAAYISYTIYFNDESFKTSSAEVIVQKDNNITVANDEENLINQMFLYFNEMRNSFVPDEIEDETVIISDQPDIIIEEEPAVDDLLPQEKSDEIKADESTETTIDDTKQKQVLISKETISVKEPLPTEESLDKDEKKVDLVILQKFKDDLKLQITNSIVTKDSLNKSTQEELQIRITVLKDGSFEDLTFISGDKNLFDMNEENIKNIFPIAVDAAIVDDFPRYIRLTIE